MFVTKKSGLSTYNSQIRFYFDGEEMHSAWPPSTWPKFSFTRKDLCFHHTVRAEDRGVDLSDLSPLEKFLMPDPTPRVGYTCLPLPQVFNLVAKLFSCPIDGLLSPKTSSNILPLIVPRSSYQSKMDYIGHDRPVLIVDLSETESFPTKYLEYGEKREDLPLYLEQALFNWLYEHDMVT